jgi:hypothetical protein
MMDTLDLEAGTSNPDYAEYSQINLTELFLKAMANDHRDCENEDRDVDAELGVSDSFSGIHHLDSKN